MIDTSNENPAIKLMSPDGVAIIGTLEVVPGVALLSSLQRDEAGKVSVEYAGQTELRWNDQRTVMRKRNMLSRLEIVFVDEDGGEWLESELVPIPAE